ncbi:hypothetical protein JOF41_001499 [Saccharothrix coeruleofusca]|uniref:LapA family protein n=1 Tax=Saccharothrix coeruleofusca TaxID=33919 RepID=UPI001AE24056|nr:LapA family protein [Saccharothrix coeruleofusca]MBP2335321.1 hypothetical protein [Saccharothrix coeruleofusca]
MYLSTLRAQPGAVEAGSSAPVATAGAGLLTDVLAAGKRSQRVGVFWLFAQVFVLCAAAFGVGALLTWLRLRSTIRGLRAELERRSAPAGSEVEPATKIDPAPVEDAEPRTDVPVAAPAIAAVAEPAPAPAVDPEPVVGGDAKTTVAEPAPEPVAASAVAEPAVAEPAAVEPAVAEPVVAESAPEPAVEPVVEVPAPVEPAAVEPAVAEPVVAESAPEPAAEPVVEVPAPVEPAAVEPAAAEPVAVEPAPESTAVGTEPAAAEPVAVATEPVAEAAPVAAPAPDAEPVLIKGSSKSMIFHTPDSPYFRRMKGDVTFNSVAEAERAGYTQWRPKAGARQD